MKPIYRKCFLLEKIVSVEECKQRIQNKECNISSCRCDHGLTQEEINIYFDKDVKEEALKSLTNNKDIEIRGNKFFITNKGIQTLKDLKVEIKCRCEEIKRENEKWNRIRTSKKLHYRLYRLYRKTGNLIRNIIDKTHWIILKIKMKSICRECHRRIPMRAFHTYHTAGICPACLKKQSKERIIKECDLCLACIKKYWDSPDISVLGIEWCSDCADKIINSTTSGVMKYTLKKEITTTGAWIRTIDIWEAIALYDQSIGEK